jgi:hypothetical protein
MLLLDAIGLGKQLQTADGEFHTGWAACEIRLERAYRAVLRSDMSDEQKQLTAARRKNKASAATTFKANEEVKAAALVSTVEDGSGVFEDDSGYFNGCVGSAIAGAGPSLRTSDQATRPFEGGGSFYNSHG